MKQNKLVTINKKGEVVFELNVTESDVIDELYKEEAYIFSAGTAAVKFDGKWGLLNKKGQWVLPPLSENPPSLTEGLYHVRPIHKACLLDSNGFLFVPPKYDLIGDFREELARVEAEQKWGFINPEGKEIIPLSYDYANEFAEGLAAVRVGDKWGFINHEETFVIAPQYEDTWKFSEGLAYARINGLFGFIDKEGNWVIPPEYRLARNFTNEGIACMNIEKRKWVGINRCGEIVTPKFDHEFHFSEGLAGVVLDGKCGFINTKGEWVIPPKFESVGSFSEGLAPVWINNKVGFIDNAGNMLISPIYEGASPFSEGLSCIMINEKWGYIDRNNQIIIDPVYTYSTDFSEGYAFVMIENPEIDDDEEIETPIHFIRKRYLDKYIGKINYSEPDDQQWLEAHLLLRDYDLIILDDHLRNVKIIRMEQEKEGYSPALSKGINPINSPIPDNKDSVREVYRNQSNELIKEIKEKWSNILKKIRQRKIQVHAWLLDGHPTIATDNKLVVVFRSAIHRSTTEKTNNKQVIEEVLEEFTGRSYKLVTIMEQNWNEIRKEKKTVSVDIIESNGTIIHSINNFEEEILKVKLTTEMVEVLNKYYQKMSVIQKQEIENGQIRLKELMANRPVRFAIEINKIVDIFLLDSDLYNLGYNLLDRINDQVFLDRQCILTIENHISNEINSIGHKLNWINQIQAEETALLPKWDKDVSWVLGDFYVNQFELFYKLLLRKEYFKGKGYFSDQSIYDQEDQLVDAIYSSWVFLRRVAVDYYSNQFLNMYGDKFHDVQNLSLEDCVLIYSKSNILDTELEKNVSQCTYYLMKHKKFPNEMNDNMIKCHIKASKLLNEIQENNKLTLFEDSLRKKKLIKEKITMNDIDLMDGKEFEKIISLLFNKMGFSTRLTKISGDQGIDIIAERDGQKIGIQAKRYTGSVTNKAIQEVTAGINHYDLDKGIVITNSYFTTSAIQLAETNNILLWDRITLKDKIQELF